MAATWSDIRRLAADFQRIQLTGEAKKLSENNCIEVVSMLIKLRAIDIVFTTNGQSYVTRKHLLTEIRNECMGQGGRVSLANLARTLNLDYEHIENAVSTILKQSSAFTVCNSELISKDYINVLCDDLNESLDEAGVISVAQLARSWDLPTEILNNLVLVEIGQKIKAVRDGDTLYTNAHLNGQRNILRGILCALTKVTPIAKIQQEVCLTPNIFWTLFDQLLEQKEVAGELIGGRSSGHSFYVPFVHSQLVKEYVRKTFFQEKMMELLIFKKLWILDPKSFLKELLGVKDFSKLVFLPTAVLRTEILDEITAAVKDELKNKTYVRLRDHVPELLQTDKDLDEIMQCLSKQKLQAYFEGGLPFMYTEQLLMNSLKTLEGYMQRKVEEFMQNQSKQQKSLRKEEKRQETAPSRTKKGKGRGSVKSVNDDSSPAEASRPTTDEIEQELSAMGGITGELLPGVALQLLPKVESLLRERYQTALQNVHMVGVHEQKRTHVRMQRTMHTIYDNICVFEFGADTFDSQIATGLKVHLLRTLCADFANTALSYVVNVDSTASWSTKERNQAIESIENEQARQAITKIFASLNTKDLNQFHDAAMNICSPRICSLNLKMPDKNRRIELVKAYCTDLERQLSESTDLAAALLCALIIEIARRYNVALHASGKFVAHMIEKLMNDLESKSQLLELFSDSQKLVIADLQLKGDNTLQSKLNEKLTELKTAMLPGE